MGRSVSFPADAVVAYQHIDLSDFDDQDDFSWVFEDLVDGVAYTAQTFWRSFEPCDTWLGREDRAILRNRHAYLGVSEYCGLVAIWLVVRDDAESQALAEKWVAQVAPTFLEQFGTLRRIGTASNGEAFFQSLEAA